MPDKPIFCPVCEGTFGTCSHNFRRGDTVIVECSGCGHFTTEYSAARILTRDPHLKPIQRAALSHSLRRHASSSTKPFHITFKWLKDFLSNARLPTPATQTANLIALIGDSVVEHGEGLVLDIKTHVPVVGTFDHTMLYNLIQQLIDRRIVQSIGREEAGPRLNLTLKGWERYDARKRGRFAGRYGFVAMKFNEPDLDSLIHETVKPAVQEKLNYDLVDMRYVPRAGVIDNLMRTQLRDAAFVLADLTHDNYGAYWEAGYAEGLGKPVIYLCEKAKFEKQKTHFDTNHCTTVLWSSDDLDSFVQQLIATLRNSLIPF